MRGESHFHRRPTATIAAVTSTVCRLFGIDCPDASLERPLDPVIDQGRKLGIQRFERILLYAPDAFGLHLSEAYSDAVAPVAREAPIAVTLRSVVPPVTPVCFASMFTGHEPSVHGIREYAKPVLRCETLFDRLVRAGRSVAIVAVRDSSIDRIFRDRAIDYFSEGYDPQVTERTLQLLHANSHDFVLAYHQEYDDTMHRTAPRAEAALAAMRAHVSAFVRLADGVKRCWRAHSRVIAFVPDHGAHIDPETGKGTHGADLPEDMDVRHFLRPISRRRLAADA